MPDKFVTFLLDNMNIKEIIFKEIFFDITIKRENHVQLSKKRNIYYNRKNTISS